MFEFFLLYYLFVDSWYLLYHFCLQDNLLRRGFVPPKTTLAIIIKTLGLFEKKTVSSTEVTAKDNFTFKFLLDILDAFGKRKLELSGQFYAAILAEGARMGGLEKRIASLIVQGRIDASARGLNVEEPAAVLKPTRQVSWAELVENYAELKDILGEISLLPNTPSGFYSCPAA